MAEQTVANIDLERLMKLRLIVARYGEMDVARWWNTQGVLGARAGLVYARGFPRTRSFAQARVVFAVARARSAEVFDPPRCLTLWNLPADVEEAFEDHWQDWLDRAADWQPFFTAIERITLAGGDLLDVMTSLDLLDPRQLDEARRLKRSLEARAVLLPGVHEPGDEVLTLLAAGFWRGEPGAAAIPYARREA